MLIIARRVVPDRDGKRFGRIRSVRRGHRHVAASAAARRNEVVRRTTGARPMRRRMTYRRRDATRRLRSVVDVDDTIYRR